MVTDSNKAGKLDKFIEQIGLIDPEVKRAAMAEYLRRVRLKDAVAFSQWRYRLNGPDRKQIKTNIAAISKVFFQDVNIAKAATEATIKASHLKFEVEEEFDILCTSKQFIEQQPFLVHTFWSIGMADPFPDESTTMDEDNKWIGPEPFTISQPVYPTSRYRPDQSPKIIYIPSRYLMIKILRACFGCATADDLWFNQLQ